MILRFGASQKANGRSSQYGAAKMRGARSCQTHHDFQTLGSVLEAGQFAAGKYVSRANPALACLSGIESGCEGCFRRKVLPMPGPHRAKALLASKWAQQVRHGRNGSVAVTIAADFHPSGSDPKLSFLMERASADPKFAEEANFGSDSHERAGNVSRPPRKRGRG